MESTGTILLIDEHQAGYAAAFASIGKDYGFAVECRSDTTNLRYLLEPAQHSIDAIVISSCFLFALTEIRAISPFLPVLVLIPGHTAADSRLGVGSLRAGAFNFIARSDFDATAVFPMLQVAVAQYRENLIRARYERLKENYSLRYPLYNQVLQVSEMILTNLLKKKLMFQPTIEHRIKDFDSFYQKIIRKEMTEGLITDPFSRFSDIAGLRLIFYNADDLQRAAGLITDSDDFLDAKTGGKTSGDDRTKSHGYRAMHFDVRINPAKREHLEEYQQLGGLTCEIQMKTVFAHAWSKVSHKLSYKKAKTPLQLANGFQEAAKSLEAIEQQLNALCREYGTNGN